MYRRTTAGGRGAHSAELNGEPRAGLEGRARETQLPSLADTWPVSQPQNRGRTPNARRGPLLAPRRAADAGRRRARCRRSGQAERPRSRTERSPALRPSQVPQGNPSSAWGPPLLGAARAVALVLSLYCGGCRLARNADTPRPLVRLRFHHAFRLIRAFDTWCRMGARYRRR
ncbi:hypothetical protein ACFPRL_08330 [Pseudoclavibacter helvolus]